MFAGIIEGKAPITSLKSQPGGKSLHIDLGKFADRVKEGDSISVNGVCLTVTKQKDTIATFNIITESLKKTTLGNLQEKGYVNIERSLKVGDRIDGHYVQGHVDGTGTISKKIDTKEEFKLWVKVGELIKYIAGRGSIAINGVSLTVTEVKGEEFAVALIPTTLELTTLGELKQGDPVNIETDILARQTVKWLENNQR